MFVMITDQIFIMVQSEEALRMRKRRRIEALRLIDMERRQKQRLEEMRESQKKVFCCAFCKYIPIFYSQYFICILPSYLTFFIILSLPYSCELWFSFLTFAFKSQVEETINLKEQYRAEVRKELEQMETRYRDLASLLRGLGIHVRGGQFPLPHEVSCRYPEQFRNSFLF